MADRIYANTETYQQIAKRLSLLAQELGDAASLLNRVNTDQDAGGTLRIGLGGRLRGTGASMPSGQLAYCVRSMRSVIRGLRDHTGDLAERVRATASLFENVEHELARLEPGTGEDAVFSNESGEGKSGRTITEIINECVQIVFDATENLKTLFLDGTVIGGVAGTGLGFLLPMSNPGDFDPLLLSRQELSEYNLMDFLDGTVADDMKSRLHESTSVSAETGGSASVFSWDGAVSNSHGSAEAHMDFLKAEGEASASAQLFDKDGNFRPGAEAHVGGSVTIFEAGASGEYEIIDGVKVHASTDVTVGEASAEAEANIGFDEDGNLNVNASASMEAILAEAKADVGFDVGGVDVTGKVGVNIGVGAHADVGYKDGVLSFDVGASLGLGVEVAFEVDVGGAIDKAKDFVSDGLDNIRGWAEGIFSFG